MRADNIRPYATMLNSQTNPNLSTAYKTAFIGSILIHSISNNKSQAAICSLALSAYVLFHQYIAELTELGKAQFFWSYHRAFANFCQCDFNFCLWHTQSGRHAVYKCLSALCECGTYKAEHILFVGWLYVIFTLYIQSDYAAGNLWWWIERTR